MTKSIKIRPYRVFKKDGRHYVKINNKKVYIATHKRTRSNKSHGDKQIVRVVVNNLMAQRKAYRRRTKKDLIPALIKGAPSAQPANGKATPGKVDLIDVPPSDPPQKTEQAPTTDPLYVQKKTTTNH